MQHDNPLRRSADKTSQPKKVEHARTRTRGSNGLEVSAFILDCMALNHAPRGWQ